MSSSTRCSTCDDVGHAEPECYFRFRSFLPWKEEIRKVDRMIVSCYACGANTHFGDDCPDRPHPKEGERTPFSAKEANRYLTEAAQIKPPMRYEDMPPPPSRLHKFDPHGRRHHAGAPPPRAEQLKGLEDDDEDDLVAVLSKRPKKEPPARRVNLPLRISFVK
ncbi:hypothetical protein NA57DRAFT_55411 [Rhizodiscina lignyota]|uniref:CCHC-type domain-containing protein n=1 Tax=Rhizodiscina lignyota TaxID=1504668 RepID=A0A9P4IHL1_9PEZI|nr:hypothetical protein NA57DRAFT_55411 [Rhizodiscina lignyota]